MPSGTFKDLARDSSQEKLQPWMHEDPNIILAWDSVNTSALMTCPWKFKLHIIEGYTPKKMAPPLEFGILFHKCVEFYEYEKVKRPEVALRNAVRYGLIVSKGFEGDSDETSPVRTRFTLIRALVWYADKYHDDPLQTLLLPSGRPAAELSFRLALPALAPDDSPYIYCGHIDRVGSVKDGETLIADYKTTKTTITPKWFRKFDSSWQMTGYTFAGSVLLPDPPTGVIVEGLQTAVGFTRLARGKTERNEMQIHEWLADFIYWIKLAEKFAEDDYWPMNRQSCDVYGGCMFKKVCDMAPDGRAEWLDADFKVERWNPLVSRGE